MRNYRRPPKLSPSDETAMRLGSAILGMFAGAALGLFLALLLLFVLERNAALPLFVFGGAGIGATVGYFASEAGFALAEGTVHFFVGLISSQAEEPVHPNHDAPQWLKRTLWLGFGVGVAISIWWCF